MLGVFDLLNKTWEVYKDRLGTLIGIAIIPIAANFLLFIPLALGGILAGSFSDGMSTVTAVIFSSLALLLAMAWIVFVVTWPAVALLYAIKGREEGIGFKESFRRAWDKIASYLWVNFLVGLAVLGGLILLIIPGIIFAVWFTLASYVLVAENKKGTSALSRSKELVQGNWWAVLGRIAFMGLIGMIAGMVIGWIPIIGPLATNVLLTPFSVVFFYLLYEDLKDDFLQESSQVE